MGLHQDKDESKESLAAGLPVVSVSIGDAAQFLFGGRRRRDRAQELRLESGDVCVFGGEARLRSHGVSRIEAGSETPGLPFEGRLNLTCRQF
jgi:alkylated DNA repair dioxygenase AlkB